MLVVVVDDDDDVIVLVDDDDDDDGIPLSGAWMKCLLMKARSAGTRQARNTPAFSAITAAIG